MNLFSTPTPVASAPVFRPLGLADLGGRAGPPDWLWDGYLAAGAVTLFTSLWKSGKTTLVSVLFAKMAAGDSLAGRAVRAGRAVVLSEEDPSHWAGRHARLGFGNNVGLLCRPFLGRPSFDQWQAMIDQLVALRAADGLDLVVIDPLASFLPARNENSAKAVLDALLPLQRLTSAGVGVLVLHHPSKADRAAGQAARGSGALAGYVDVLIEMTYVGHAADDDRRRRLTAFSRFPATPQRLVIELNPEGTDYDVVDDVDSEGMPAGHGVLLDILGAAGTGLTRAQILARWPADRPAPGDVGLWRWLERAVRDRVLTRTGTGVRADPFRYGVAGPRDRWANEAE